MPITVEGGAWKKGRRARVHKTFLVGPSAISLPVELAFLMERVEKQDIATVQLVTDQMRNEAANKAAAGVAGGLLLGPVGLIAGVVMGRGSRSHLVILQLADGRSALLKCDPDELGGLLSLGAGQRSPM
ncbi:MAG: hypothetical protein GC206_03995 [Alphaproteobacteria bacterium]|nr:hypothetical protein [Alphaproteobacteria bacterium]